MTHRNDFQSTFETLREREWEQPSHKARLARDILGAPAAPSVGAQARRRRPLVTLAIAGAGIAGVSLAGVGVFEMIRSDATEASVTVDAAGVLPNEAEPGVGRPVVGAEREVAASTRAPSGGRAPEIGARSAPAVGVVEEMIAGEVRIAAVDSSVPVGTSARHEPFQIQVEGPTLASPGAGDGAIFLYTSPEHGSPALWAISTCRRGDLERLHPEVITLRADLDGDGTLGAMDIVRFTEGYVMGDVDLNGDGVTNAYDYVRFTQSYFNSETELKREGLPRVASIEASPFGPDEDVISIERAAVTGVVTTGTAHDASGAYLVQIASDLEALEWNVDRAELAVVDVLRAAQDAASGESEEVRLIIETVIRGALEPVPEERP